MKLTTTLVLCSLFTSFVLHAQGHSNNWAVLVDTSAFWFNYRHVSNTLSIYHTVKKLGIPDSNIILMLAEDVACNDRNYYKAQVFNDAKRDVNIYGEHVEVDYRGKEVTLENFLRVLTNRVEENTPLSKRLNTDAKSNILIYMTGHGGNQFLKFQDTNEITSQDIANAFQQMEKQRRYHEILFVIDTCQANSMFSTFDSPNVVSVGSSDVGENSYSHHSERKKLGVAVIDRFTFFTLQFFKSVESRLLHSKGEKTEKEVTLLEWFEALVPLHLRSHHGWNSTLSRPLSEVPVKDFFGSTLNPVFNLPRTKLKVGESSQAKVTERSFHQAYFAFKV